MEKKRRHKIFLAVKFLISIAILYFVIKKCNFENSIKILSTLKIAPLFFSFLLYILAQILSSYKWSLLTKPLGFEKPLAEHTSLYFVGMFFNLFLPSTIGGDVARGYFISKDNRKRLEAAFSIIMERGTGVLVLFLWPVLVIPFIYNKVSLPQTVYLFLITVTILLWIFFFFSPFLVKKGLKLFKKEEKLGDFFLVCWKDAELLKKVFLLSAVFHFIFIVCQYLIGYGIGIKVPFTYYFFLAPVVAFISFLPVSFNGLGIREASYLYFFSAAGTAKEEAVIFGLIWLIILTLSSSIGGIFFLKNHLFVPENETDY